MTELVPETSRVPASSALRPGGREAVDPIEEGRRLAPCKSICLGPFSPRDTAVCGAGWHPAWPGRSWQGVAQPGQVRRPRAVGSDAEAFLPAIDVPKPQVDIRADALQGLQPKGTTEVFCISPRRGQPEAKAVHGSRLAATVHV